MSNTQQLIEPILIAQRKGGYPYYVYSLPGVGWNMHPAFNPPLDISRWGGYPRIDALLKLYNMTLDDLRI